MSGMTKLSKFRNEVTQYDFESTMQICSHISNRLDGQQMTVLAGTLLGGRGNLPIPRRIVVSHHALATVAMLALRNHPWSKGRQPMPQDIVRLANNVHSIEHPFVGDEHDALMLLVRICHQQWPFQEPMWYFIPRHLLLYTNSSVSSPAIDPQERFLHTVGLTIREFIVIGMLMYASALQNHTFDRAFLEHTSDDLLRPYVVADKIDAFLSVAGADPATFRQLCLDEERECPRAGPYQFNPLFARPVIIRKDGLLCLPVPRLAMHRVTRGLYYDLLEYFRRGDGNPFLEWFGHAFEAYGGLLLRDAFGERRVFPEPHYGKPQRAGPDWTVIGQESALVVELRSGRLNKMAKTYADYSDVITILRRNIVQTLLKLPSKIEDLKSGETGIPTTRGMRYLPAVVTYEPLYPHELMVALIKRELEESGMTGFQFELMSIEDLELLLACASHADPMELLEAKRSNDMTRGVSMRNFVARYAEENAIRDLRNPLLERTMSQYLGRLSRALAQQHQRPKQL